MEEDHIKVKKERIKTKVPKAFKTSQSKAKNTLFIPDCIFAEN